MCEMMGKKQKTRRIPTLARVPRHAAARSARSQARLLLVANRPKATFCRHERASHANADMLLETVTRRPLPPAHAGTILVSIDDSHSVRTDGASARLAPARNIVVR